MSCCVDGTDELGLGWWWERLGMLIGASARLSPVRG